jgi:hypothetical protein
MSLPALIIPPLFELGKAIIDRVFPDKVAQATERAKAELELATLAHDGRLKEMSTQLSAIIAEAESEDKWTSRARPSFMYVMYTMILAALPAGIGFAFNPDVVISVTTGVKAWLGAIPEEMWWLFGTGYLGYAVTRSWDKKNGVV